MEKSKNYQFPKLSRSMRKNSNLEFDKSLSKTESSQTDLSKSSLLANSEASWKKLKTFIVNQNEERVSLEIVEQLNKLRSLTKKVMGTEESGEIIEDATIFILNLFLNREIVMSSDLQQLKNKFGLISLQEADNMWKLVQDIKALLNDECVDYIKSNLKENERTLWGLHIVCNIPNNEKPDFSLLANLCPNLSAVAPLAKNFSMQYNYDEQSSAGDNNNEDELYSRSWLCKHINPKLVNTLIELLKTKKSNDELQNDLFEFLGFDKFDIIQQLLENRKEILHKIKSMDKKSQISDSIFLKQSLTTQKYTPPMANTVVIQSEEEKKLMKQVRKDEKKINKFLNKDIDEEDKNSVKMRFIKQQKLLEIAQKKPILTDLPDLYTPKPPKIKYPYVFDSQSEAKNHVGFIAGSRLYLPLNITRIDNKLYEEVQIPANEPPPLSIGNSRVQIASLDDISRIAFQGVKELNRIQSIVFQTAYNTNENLLVCAPTGAGKTNVAMLSILYTIRSYAENDIIHHEKFKIVYVAPMKALAAEMVENFSKRLQPLNIIVKELTGDIQLTKYEIQQTQILVTTPEKWDVVTRKGSGDVALISLVKLLIIDEVHLLHGERGPVVEALVARTLRLVESTQNMIRIVGLSATLPNYIDVAKFLRVNPMKGLFFFDSRFRPVPLSTNFIGIKSIKPLQQLTDMDIVCYDKCIEMLSKGHQILVFVHARNATVRTANVLREMAQQKNQLGFFSADETNISYSLAAKAISRSRNKQLIELFQCGLAMHNAGMLRSDRTMVEKYFSEGHIKVLVCTATLAWGVNLPAHAVIIKGTEIYDSKHGSFVDLDILDVLQIFGRAGRPQFDKSGVGTIITTHDKLNHYLSLLTNQFPIESNFIQYLADNLNAEITLGTISNIDEAITWLSYTYLFVRMRINPQVYGINYADVYRDPSLEQKRRELIISAAMNLDKAQMIRFNVRTGDLNATDLGRTASHFYIKYDTVETFNEMIHQFMNEGEILAMISHAQEFQQLKVRDDELDELDEQKRIYCEITPKGGSENLHGKVNILMQTYLSRGFVKSFSLISDMTYITQNVVRLARALFTIVLRKNNAILAGRMLTISKMFERKMWDFESPLRQFSILGQDIIDKLESRNLSIQTLRETNVKEIGELLRNPKYGALVLKCAEEFPLLDIDAALQPITRTVLRIRVFITANFKWNDRVHGKISLGFWLWIEDPESNFIYHSEFFQLTRKQVYNNETQELVMTIPLKEPLPPQYYIRASSDLWLGSETWVPLSFQHLILPELHPPHTELLPLEPLALDVLNNKKYESLYSFTHFNPIQTQIFHCLYYTDNNVLLGAPTGSGKTIAAEIAMFRVFNNYPKAKVVYIAPLKALVRERIADWKIRIEKKLNKKVVELTGDVTPDIRSIRESQVIVTTPEKWDGISRSWQTRDYVRDVALIIIDEIHLLGEDRGPVLEVIVSRTNFIASHTERTLRIIGLSTALANARDLANWLGIGNMGLYNFKPSVRPVPLSVHINGFPGKFYCPRMATMNRPTFQAIRQYSPSTPALIFVSSRRQTRLTALDLIAFLAAEDNPKQFLHIPEDEMVQILESIKDSNLKLTLAFGIGLHHAGLHENDRKTVEELFLNRKIQLLIATATLAWGVNLPAHLVVIKGTEYYDGKTKRYVDMPITDVLQMMGRAGRPQFDDQGIAVVLVHDVKKNFYKKFLYDPFPVESNLVNVLPDHINAEIVAGTVQTKQSILDYLTWTYFFRRLLRNPIYYSLENIESKNVNLFLSDLVEKCVNALEKAGCVQIMDRYVYSTSMGRISSYYYLSYYTMKHFSDTLRHDMTIDELLRTMCDAYEFNQQPVRHNEDILNGELGKLCRIKVDPLTYDNPHTKTFLLMQAHFSRLPLPNSDYLTDTKSVLDQSIRVLQAMIDIVAENGWLSTTLNVQLLMQCVIQARWYDEPIVMSLPNVEEHNYTIFNKIPHGYEIATLPGLKEKCLKNYNLLAGSLREEFSEPEIEQIYKVLCEMPTLNVEISLRGRYYNENDKQTLIKQPLEKNVWITVHANEEYTLNVSLYRIGQRKKDSSIHCPKFPKGKDESWFLTLGNQANYELIALKRANNRNARSSHQISFITPSKIERILYTLYIISDGYIGFDQQYDIQLEVIEGINTSNTEITTISNDSIT